MKKTTLLGCVASLVLGTLANGAELVAFYNVTPVDKAPVIDGKLDDPCWSLAETSDVYYKYLAQTPVKGELNTAYKMVYDAKGIYLAVINYDKNLDKLHVKAVARDDAQLWMDDCNELYFDPLASSIGFVKFTVNAIGTQADMKRIDAAIELADWSGNNWVAVVGRTGDAWIMEAFLPWSDLGREAREGDIWRFAHVRYSWPEGSFKGVSSALGAGYFALNRFGFLRFSGKSKPDAKTVLDILARDVAAPWTVLLDGKIASYDVNKNLSSFSPADYVNDAEAAFTKANDKLKGLGIAGDPGKLADNNAGPKQAELEAYLKESESVATAKADTPMAALELGAKLQALADRADAIYWQIKARDYIAEVAAKPVPVKK